MKVFQRENHRFVRRLRFLVGLAIVFAASGRQPGFGQDAVNPPTSRNSAAADSVMRTMPAEQTGLSAPIKYDARLIDNDVRRRITTLIGDAVVKYENMTIEAGKITVDLSRKILIAEALPETLQVAADSLANNGHADTLTVRPVGFPVFSDGADQMRGERMEYNFVTGRGLVVRGRTSFDDGKYFGEQIKRVAPNVLNVSHGTYTTCDLEENPHYHFWARRMKIIVGKRVIAKPIVMFLGHIPVAALPFAMFPTESGRRSGVIVPRFGISEREGRYLRGLGYYWAASDYFDARAMVDFYEKSGWLFRAGANYALRYHFNGAISGSLTRKNFANGVAERRWDLTIRHNQTLDKTASLRVDATFLSDNSFYRDFSFNQIQRLTRILRSQATFSKSWPGWRSNLSISLSEEKDLDTGEIRRTLPSLQFYFNERPLFGSGPSSGGSQAGVVRGAVNQPWYRTIYIRYNLSTQNRYQKKAVDSDSAETVFETERFSLAYHDISLRMGGPQLFGWIRFNQSIRIDEDWFDREYVYEDSSLSRSERKGFFPRHTFSYNASANTTLYGLFPWRIGPITAFRHVVTPSLSFSYRPDFSDPRWGYYTAVRDANGNETRLDRFSGTPRGKLASMSLSVGNLFQMKTMHEGKEKKVDLFRLNFNTSYNFAAKEKKLGNLSTSLNANPSRNVNLSISLTHSPYVYEQTSPTNGREINRYLFQEHGIFSGRWLRLQSLSISSRISLRGKSASTAVEQSQGPAGFSEEAPPGVVLDRFEGEVPFSDTAIPWNVSFTFRYSLSKFNPLQPIRRAYIDISDAEFRLSRNWRVRFRGQFDLVKKQLVGQHWSIYRDLHCWEASFNWTPIGPGKGFYLRINIKAPQLQDIKFEKHGGRSSIFGGNYFY